MHRRNLILGAGAALAAGILPVSAREMHTVSGPAFGSYWRAVLPVSVPARGVLAAIRNVVNSVDREMSPFRASSDLGRLNSDPDNLSATVSQATGTVVTTALKIANLTSGAFDPTVGPLVNRFGFGPIRGSFAGSYSEVAVSGTMIHKSSRGQTLDVCGIAKGFAVDQMARALDAAGADTYMVEAGGEIFAKGLHPSGRSWRVAIEAPGGGLGMAQRIVRLEGMAVATSGLGVNAGGSGGVSFNHIIDPRTQRPVDNAVVSVTVITRSAMYADALATGLFVLGPERGLALAEDLGLAVMFVMKGAQGIFELRSPYFDEFIVV